MKHPIKITGGLHTGEIVLPAGFDVAWRPAEIRAFQIYRESRIDQSRPIFYGTKPPHRCPYCQTLVLTTAAVRCGSCGAPR